MSSTGWIAPSSAAARCNGMELLDKLAILTDAAKYDAACTSSGVRRSARPGMIGNTTSSIAGCCHSFSADGRCITLLKVLMTNSCVFDCKYCVNRRSNDTRRAAFTPRELAELTIGFYRRNYIEGLFLSSGVLRSPDYTTERMIECLRILREEYRFNGYIHAKAIPGTSPELVQQLGLLADRLSVNIELPSQKGLQTLAPDKSKQAILRPMAQIRDRARESKAELVKSRHAPVFAPAGQSTQLIVGATADNDRHILHLTQSLYEKYRLKRVFYSAYVPVVENSLLPSKDTKPPLRREHRLCYINYAYENVHFPDSPEALTQARRRLAFEELFLLTCGLRLLRSRREDVSGPACRKVSMDPFYNALPFTLTDAQRRAVEDAIGDMTAGRPMNRLCQGDVGSGKTMVAAACIWFAAQSGWQSALMAPTEILARQHFETLSPLMARLGLTCALLTGSTRARERRETLAGLAAGTIDLCIGTHALLTGDVQYGRLGLVVTDEQHRFGVNQRAALSQKAEAPHMLVLSATPIPRTLALVIYGDLDVSVIDQLPPGRQKVDTFALGESYRPRVNAFLRKQVQEGHQVFIVCPLVGDGDTLPDERKAVTAYAKKLQEETFPDLRVSVLHGKMKPKEKEKVMETFAAGESDVLVSTTVVEVGVDVPNATCMVVENAERFGLSQLHQLRGRVGRGRDKSYCFLLMGAEGETARERLLTLKNNTDGFKIAEKDLEMRGSGDFFGTRQSGKMLNEIRNLQYSTSVIFAAKKMSDEAFEGHFDTAALREAAIKKYNSLKDVVLN